MFEPRLAVAAVVAMLALAGCAAGPPDRHQQADQVTQRIGALPAVVSASDVVADSVDAGLVYAEVHVLMTDDATADQVAAVTSTYLDHLRDTDYSGYRTELDVRRGASTFVVGNGREQLTNGQQIVGQARDWSALLDRFRGAAVTLHSAVAAQPAAGRVALQDSSAYPDVAAAFATLAATAPNLAGGHWIVGAGREHPAEVTTTGRWPTAAELTAWSALNADQSIPHADGMTVNGPTTGPLWFAEITRSHDRGVALQLARTHLPIVAKLPAPVLYTATDSWSGHLDATGQATSPTVVTVGGCTRRTYRAAPDEQALANAYETCKR
ncbi:hypothetical protein MMAD_07430 [Mycolicibacterium madagascariense]|uniref:Lipoprotein n=1 Tax=Mycolicibacterium madagascariense TaxID=212765 RepID=A0A7I7XDF9_9MYCO|nr:hypothetical protein MMAD_07430 [Mycolicibacterium madagascariense]